MAFRHLSNSRPQWLFRCIRPIIEYATEPRCLVGSRGISTCCADGARLLEMYSSGVPNSPPAGCLYKYWILSDSGLILTPYLLPSTSLNYPPDYDENPPPGCDFMHWVVAVDLENINYESTPDEYIDGYVQILAMVFGSEEEARQKIYSVSTRCFTAFGCNVSKEIAGKIKELPRVSTVFPDSYEDVENKKYGGEPFIDGQVVPYDPKYHENYYWFLLELASCHQRETWSDSDETWSDSDEEFDDHNNCDKATFSFDSDGEVFSGCDSEKNFSNNGCYEA